jgi:hypothetical protein
MNAEPHQACRRPPRSHSYSPPPKPMRPNSVKKWRLVVAPTMAQRDRSRRLLSIRRSVQVDWERLGSAAQTQARTHPSQPPLFASYSLCGRKLIVRRLTRPMVAVQLSQGASRRLPSLHLMSLDFPLARLRQPSCPDVVFWAGNGRSASDREGTRADVCRSNSERLTLRPLRTEQIDFRYSLLDESD